MTVETIPAIRYYYDEHPTEEDRMGESAFQDWLNKYLILILERLFRVESWYIARNLNIYTTAIPKEYPVAPDVAVYKGVVVRPEQLGKIKSWSLALPDHPPPAVVFEIASDETADVDVDTKPDRYARMGVKEYYFYDPRPDTKEEARLQGWRNQDGQALVVEKDERGWLWSDELESWLVPDGLMLRLYDRDLNQRLTGEEAERAAKEAERAAKEAERAAKERAWAKLREHGIDPESI